MRFLKNKFLWMTLYALAITFVFLLLLFPSDLALKKVSQLAAQAGVDLQATSLRPALPLGATFKNISVRLPQPPSELTFTGERLDVRLAPLSLFSKNKRLSFKSKAYGGTLDGWAEFASLERPDLPAAGVVRFTDIDLARVTLPAGNALKGLESRITGTLDYASGKSGAGATGKLSLLATQIAYPLPEPFLGMTRIAFTRGEITARLDNRTVKIDKLDFYGAQMNGFFTGDIQLGDRMETSLLNLKGVLELAGQSKIKMNVTVTGTLDKPSLRYL